MFCDSQNIQLYLIIDLYVVKVNSFYTPLLSHCTDEYEHTYGISTYSVISDCVSDSSLEPQCLGSCYVLRVRTLAIHRSMQRRVEKQLTCRCTLLYCFILLMQVC